MEALAINIIERIGLFVVEAPKQSIDHLDPLLCGKFQGLGDDPLSIGGHIPNLTFQILIDNADRWSRA